MKIRKYVVLALLALAFSFCSKNVEAQAKEVVCFTQAELEAALKDKSVDTVAISSVQDGIVAYESEYYETRDSWGTRKVPRTGLIMEPSCKKFVIPEGNYSNKILTVRAMFSDVVNNGKFKKVVIYIVDDYTEKYGNKIYTKHEKDAMWYGPLRDKYIRHTNKDGKGTYNYRIKDTDTDESYDHYDIEFSYSSHGFGNIIIESKNASSVTIKENSTSMLNDAKFNGRVSTVVDNKGLNKVITKEDNIVAIKGSAPTTKMTIAGGTLLLKKKCNAIIKNGEVRVYDGAKESKLTSTLALYDLPIDDILVTKIYNGTSSNINVKVKFNASKHKTITISTKKWIEFYAH